MRYCISTVMQTNTAYFQDNTSFDSGARTLQDTDLSLEVKHIGDNGVVDTRGAGTLGLTRNDQVLKKDNSGGIVKYKKTAFLSAYFSSANVNNIQKLLKLNVFKQIKLVIDDQSVDELLLAMGRVYELYGRHPPELESAKTKEELDKLRGMYKTEIDRLNNLVLDNTLKQLIIELQMNLYYLKDLTTPRVMENPMYTTTSGEREYKSTIQSLTGVPDEY